MHKYKTIECRHYNNGFCKFNNLCLFAHGMKELNSIKSD